MLPIAERRFTVRGREVTHWYVDSPKVACVIPLLPDGRILLERQYRAALDRWILELPAGKAEPGESVEACARRELEEETGYRAASLRELLWFWPVPGYSNEEIHLFLASGLEPGERKLDPGEELEVEALALETFLAEAEAGRIHDGKTLLAAAHLRLHGLAG
ncbi:MAG: NUDIX hydrolase [Clostridia bacterium]|nr:NUDIX hydrolase [Clostridia bacterium]MCL6522391.1 NUDIX hydrolase [Bacillota bacterium]